MISIKLPIIYEKTDTPVRRSSAVKILSKSLLGLKSPKPTVDNDVKAKYTIIMVILFDYPGCEKSFKPL